MPSIPPAQPGDTTPDLLLALCGDVMTGRGIDQILAHPSDPQLREDFVTDAREYVRLAEHVHGRIPRPVPDRYVWGEAAERIERFGSAVRLINLETSLTTSDAFWPYKGINYRMHPANVGCLTSLGIDVCSLANNHVLDFSAPGLVSTLSTLRAAGIQITGAGRDAAETQAPARVALSGSRSLLVFGVGTRSSGIPDAWAAGIDQPGVALLSDLTASSADRLLEHIARTTMSGELPVVSVHWGSNWGYDVSSAQVDFAHRLIDGGVVLVHGHSSHHPRPLERYRGRLILHGCGDFINDYEGISGYEEFRSDLRPLYLATLDGRTGELLALRIPLFRARRFALERATGEDAVWLRETLEEASHRFGTRLELSAEGELSLLI